MARPGEIFTSGRLVSATRPSSGMKGTCHSYPGAPGNLRQFCWCEPLLLTIGCLARGDGEMMRRMFAPVAALAALVFSSTALASPSVMTVAPSDARAVTVRGVGDGVADDTAAIQRAIDEAASTGAGGIVFLPQGRYRITRTLFMWPAVRLFGVGSTRPVIVLGDRTPGFQRGISNMIVFTGTSKVNALGNEGPRIPFPVPGSVPFNPKIGD